MRYVFIANPAAGKNNPAKGILAQIQEYCAGTGRHCRYEETRGIGDALRIVREEATKGEPLRVYGIGGDGTLNEIACGAVGRSQVEIGIFPCGSGNDYIRSFGKAEDFLSIKRQLSASSRPVDMIRSGEEYAINLCSAGLDAAVAYEMVRYKELPFVSGSMAYNLSLIKNFCGRLGENLELVIDGTERRQGVYLFVLAGSGRYYGGGYCGAPKAVPDDGLLDFVLIRSIGRSRMLKLIGQYKRGEHLSSPDFRDLLEFRRGKRLEIRAKEPVAVNLDGECKKVQEICFEIVPAAVRFLVP